MYSKESYSIKNIAAVACASAVFTFSYMTTFRSLTLLIIFFIAGFQLYAQHAFKSILIGKNITDTPLHNYIKEEVKGDQLILMIAYGCSHCKEATGKALQLKKEKLIDDLIVLGSEAGETDAKKNYILEFKDASPFKMIDYEWATFPQKFIVPEPKFPNPPIIFYIRDNVLLKIITEVPDSNAFKKMKGKTK